MLQDVDAEKRFLSWPMIARAFIAVQCLATGWLAVWEPDSLTAQLLATGGDTGAVIGYVMLVIGVLAILDVFVNDLLPDQWVLKITREHHGILYMLCGATFLWQAFVASASMIDSILPAYYVAEGVLCGAVAWKYGMGQYRERIKHREVRDPT